MLAFAAAMEKMERHGGCSVTALRRCGSFCCSGVVVVVDARCTSEVARRREDGVCCRIMVVADEDGGCRGFWCVAGEVRRCGDGVLVRAFWFACAAEKMEMVVAPREMQR